MLLRIPFHRSRTFRVETGLPPSPQHQTAQGWTYEGPANVTVDRFQRPCVGFKPMEPSPDRSNYHHQQIT